MNYWDLLPTLSAPMPVQMALDEILFREMLENRELGGSAKPKPVFRFYFSSEPWITVGYTHPKDQVQFKERHPACRRLTGGGVVYHGEDLIFSLTALKSHDESFGSVRASYQKIHQALQKGLGLLGKPTAFYRKDAAVPRGGECFVFPIESDLSYKDKKIAGGAQKRSLGVLMHQESMQLKVESSPHATLNLLKEGFEDVFGCHMKEANLDPKYLKRAEELAKENYPKL